MTATVAQKAEVLERVRGTERDFNKIISDGLKELADGQAALAFQCQLPPVALLPEALETVALNLERFADGLENLANLAAEQADMYRRLATVSAEAEEAEEAATEDADELNSLDYVVGRDPEEPQILSFADARGEQSPPEDEE